MPIRQYFRPPMFANSSSCVVKPHLVFFSLQNFSTYGKKNNFNQFAVKMVVVVVLLSGWLIL